MGNIMMMVIFLAILEFILFSLGLVTTPTTALFTLFTNFHNWSTLSLTTMFGGIIFGLGAVISLIGVFYKSDTLIFSGMAGVLLSYTATFLTLYELFAANSNSFIAVMCVGPIVLAYIFLVFGWLRGRET